MRMPILSGRPPPRALACALLLLVTLAFGGVPAAKLPYDASADAHAGIRHALADAARTRKNVLLVFGANWCEDCRALDAALRKPANAALMAREFKVVKIDVGHFDRNLDIAAAYGDAVSKGIPSAVVVSPDARILYATHAGELADARTMSASGVHDFFARAVQTAKAAR
ncbi:MAG TPA: thioredoxin family protein [Casimicrobiaceae bacterium]|jgi:protein disulfide-isomerase